MASLFPEIEVFTTGDSNARGLWNLEWIQNTPLKFARNLKVLDLTDIGYSSFYIPQISKNRFIDASNAVIDKLEADGVVHIGLVSFRFKKIEFRDVVRNEDMKEEITEECLLTADCVSKILSRVTVDHIVFQNSDCLEQIYAMCAQIDNAIGVTLPIHIHFQGSDDSRCYMYSSTDPCRPLQLRFYRGEWGWSGPNSILREADRIYDRFCLDLRLNPTETDISEPEFDRYAVHPSNEDHAHQCKMLTVHLNMYWYSLSLRASQGILLEDFPHIEVNPYYNSDPPYITLVRMCRDLGIASVCEWPIQVSMPLMAILARDTKSTCFDSRGNNDSLRLVDDMEPYSILNISESLQKISPEVGHSSHCVTVAVLDTGILACHEEFLNKIVAMKNFVPNEANDLCYDYNGHGTGCAGILLETAPFVRLVICKVMSCQGHGQLKWAADAINWLLNDEAGPKNYCPVDIISMSFGGSSFDPDLRRAVSDAIGLGKVVVAAASNDGRKKLTNIAFPARFGDVICVGSCNNLGQPSSFTPTGREIDFLAPGENVRSLKPGPRKSGTSEATPMVAGIAAMVISYAETVGGRTMRATVSHTAVMREVLRKMASMAGHHDEHMGYGNLDPWRLFKYGPDHFRQVVEEIVGPLPAQAQSHQPVNTRIRTRRASDSEVHMKTGGL